MSTWHCIDSVVNDNLAQLSIINNLDQFGLHVQCHVGNQLGLICKLSLNDGDER